MLPNVIQGLGLEQILLNNLMTETGDQIKELILFCITPSHPKTNVNILGNSTETIKI
jgi:hypothetical protein